MSGEFVYEDRGGNIILSSSPGIIGSTDSSKTSTKNYSKKKITDRKNYSRPVIQLFKDLADIETDELWKEMFLKMFESKFPSKITWISSIEDDELYGEIIYKNRGTNEKKEIYRDDDLFDIRNMIVDFITDYTNVETGEVVNEFNETNDDVKIVDKSKIIPFPWIKLSAKDQTSLLESYVKEFGAENNLSKKEIDDLLYKVIIFFIGKNIQKISNYLKIDEDDGRILNITNIQKNSNGVYIIKQ